MLRSLLALTVGGLLTGTPAWGQQKDSAARLVKLGRAEVAKVTDASYERAADYARKALHVDTTNALAWALLSESVGRIGPAMVYTAARRAVQLDSTSPVTV